MLIELMTRRYPGMRLWLTQRITAVVMAIYIVIVAVWMLLDRPIGYQGWRSFVQPWWVRLATWLFFVCLVIHAWLGVRDVMRDYVFNARLRNYLQALVDVLLIGYLCWATVILWNMAS